MYFKIIFIMIIIIYIIFKFVTPVPCQIGKLISPYPVVVSFTTIPTRVKYINEILKKLKSQSFQPDMIYINIPYYSSRLKQEYIIPDIDPSLLENVTIVRCKDYGPATKLLGCINRITDPNTIIITIDDDQNYHKDLLKNLVIYSSEYPNSVICNKARNQDCKSITFRLFFNKIVKSPDAFYVEGYAGVLYKRAFISDEMIEFFEKSLSPACFVSDDLTISAWLEINNIERIRTNVNYNIRSTNGEIDIKNALHREDRAGVYKKCHREMIELIKSHREMEF